MTTFVVVVAITAMTSSLVNELITTITVTKSSTNISHTIRTMRFELIPLHSKWRTLPGYAMSCEFSKGIEPLLDTVQCPSFH